MTPRLLKLIAGIILIVAAMILAAVSGSDTGIVKSDETYSVGLYPLVMIIGFVLIVGPRRIGNFILKILGRSKDQ